MSPSYSADEAAAIKGFEKKFREKTANDWNKRDAFVKKVKRTMRRRGRKSRRKRRLKENRVRREY